MDKEMRPLTEAMIATELKPAMRRFFANYALCLVGDLYDSTYTDIKELTSDENSRLRAFAAIVLKNKKIKNTFIEVLNTFKQRRDEIVAMLLEKYGCLHSNKDVNFYHDKVASYFDEEMKTVKELIIAEQYSQIHRRSSYN